MGQRITTPPRPTVDVREGVTVAGAVTVALFDGPAFVHVPGIGWRATGIRPDRVDRFPNLIVDVGRSALALGLDSTQPQPVITHAAVGSDATAPTVGDTALGTETFRKAVTATSPNGTGKLITDVYVSPGEANTSWDEIGWFINGTATPGSGTLYSRVLYSLAKTTGVSVLIRREDTFT